MIEVQEVPIGDVKPYHRNPRKNDPGVAKVADSITHFGFRQPIVVDDAMVVLAGHTRLKAAQSLGLRTVPVHIARGLSAAAAAAYRLADNRTAQESSWDHSALIAELTALRSAEVDLAWTAFDPNELNALLATDLAGVNLDRAPAVPEIPITQSGDLILLGKHRLLCGDATNMHHVTAVLDGAIPHLMVTDPPYGVNYNADWRNRALPANGQPDGGRAIGLVLHDDRCDWTAAFQHFPGYVVYCWHAGRHASSVQTSLESAGFTIRAQIIWAKPRFAISRGHYHWQHEPCWYAYREGAAAQWIGDHSQTTLWEITHQKSETGHSTQKPLEAMRRPIQNHDGDVYDPFLGSGTTLMAAESLGRICYGLEISPAYCDVIVTRWEQATGQKAMRPHG